MHDPLPMHTCSDIQGHNHRHSQHHPQPGSHRAHAIPQGVMTPILQVRMFLIFVVPPKGSVRLLIYQILLEALASA